MTDWTKPHIYRVDADYSGFCWCGKKFEDRIHHS